MIVSMERLRSVARGRVQAAVKNGTLPSPKGLLCIDCGDPAQCYDHRDYTKPLKVDSVCKTCDAQRGAGMPLPTSPDMEVEWITHYRPTTVGWRWGWLDWSSRIAHHWNVKGKVAVSKCGILSSDIRFGLKCSKRKCMRCTNEPTKKKTTKKIDLLITAQELNSLKKLANHKGITMTDIVRGMIRRSAKRKKIWDYE